jgi:hypothetical protein
VKPHSVVNKRWRSTLTEEEREVLRAKERQRRAKPENQAKSKAYNAEYYAKNSARVLAQIKARRARMGDAIRERNRKYKAANKQQGYESHARYRYGVTREQLKAMNEACGGLCEICRQPNENTQQKRLVVDHDHLTGVVRGLLCTACNTGLGVFKDNELLLAKAIMYLRKACHKEQTA